MTTNPPSSPFPSDGVALDSYRWHLTRAHVDYVLHYTHWIPISRGFTQQMLAKYYPGFTLAASSRCSTRQESGFSRGSCAAPRVHRTGGVATGRSMRSTSRAQSTSTSCGTASASSTRTIWRTTSPTRHGAPVESGPLSDKKSRPSSQRAWSTCRARSSSYERLDRATHAVTCGGPFA